MLDTLIIGGSFYGCGIASALPGTVKLVEASPVVGSDFALTFNGGSAWDTPLSTDGARTFLDELQKLQGISPSGAGAIPFFNPLLSTWCRERSLDIELSCTVISVNGGSVTLTGVDGTKTMRASRVIDARPRLQAGKWLTALITAPSTMSDGGKGPYTVRQSIFPGEFLLSFQVPDDSTWQEARAMFHRSWDMRPLSLKYSSLLLIGTRFDYRNYLNPALALEAGILAAKTMEGSAK